MELNTFLERLAELEKTVLKAYQSHPKPKQSKIIGAKPVQPHQPGSDPICVDCIKIRSRNNVLNKFFEQFLGVVPSDSSPKNMVKLIRNIILKMKEDGEFE